MTDITQEEKEVLEKAVIDKCTEISENTKKIDTAVERKEAQQALAKNKVDINEFKKEIADIKKEQTYSQEDGIIDIEEGLEKSLREELKNVQMTNEALKGILGQFVIFLEAFLPEIEKTAGDHKSFFQIQQMVMIAKVLSGEPMPEGLAKDIEKEKDGNDK